MAYNTSPSVTVLTAPIKELAEEDREKLIKIDKIDHAIDNFSDEKIGGNKIFTEAVVAEGFQLPDGRALTPSVVEEIKNNRQGAVLVSTGTPILESAPNLSYDGTVLIGKKLKFDTLEGDGGQLTNLDAGALEGKLNLETIEVGIDGALSTSNNKLSIDFDAVAPMSKTGQTVADSDKLLLYDASHDGLRHATFGELYRDYIRTKQHLPGGDRHSVQFRKGNSFGGTRNLRFDDQKSILNLEGSLYATRVRVDEELVAERALHTRGAIYQNLVRISDTEYKVKENDYTILVDVSDNKVNLILPNAAENSGRVLNIKVVNSKKSNIKSNKVIIQSDGGLLDLFEEATLKMNTSARSFQSDGENWWIISSRGP